MYPMGFLSGKEAAISDSIISQCGNGPLDNEWRTALSLVETGEGENGIEWEYPNDSQGGATDTTYLFFQSHLWSEVWYLLLTGRFILAS